MTDAPRTTCHAKAKSTGERCKRTAIPGGTVCRFHGGAAPQVIKSARRRLLELVDPAIAALAQVVEAELEVVTDKDGRPHVIGPTHAERTRDAEAILDRTGHPRRTELDVTDARTRLIERLTGELEDDDR